MAWDWFKLWMLLQTTSTAADATTASAWPSLSRTCSYRETRSLCIAHPCLLDMFPADQYSPEWTF